MTDDLLARVRARLLQRIADDGGTPEEEAEGDDPRLVDMDRDLHSLDDVEGDDPLVDRLATKYWVP